MKKISIIFITIFLLMLAACGSSSSASSNGDSVASTTDTNTAAESNQEETAAPAEEAEAQPAEEAPATEEPISEEPEPVATVSLPADFWNQVAWTFTDDDGYVVEKQVRFSPLVSMEAPETATAAWTGLGGSANELPNIDDCQSTSRYWGSNHYETGYYVMGTITYINKTAGFSFSAEKAHRLNYGSHNDYFGSSLGFLSTEGDYWNGAITPGFTRVFYSDGIKNFGPGREFVSDSSCSIECGDVTMSSDQWGPVRFIMCFANTRTPKEPNGIPELDDLYFKTYSDKTSESGFASPKFSGDFAKIHLEKIDSDSLG